MFSAPCRLIWRWGFLCLGGKLVAEADKPVVTEESPTFWDSAPVVQPEEAPEATEASSPDASAAPSGQEATSPQITQPTAEESKAESPTAPDGVAQLQQEVAQLQQEKQAWHQAQQAQQLEQQAAQYSQQLEGQGYSPEQAQSITQIQKQAYQQVVQVQQQGQRERLELEGKMVAAHHYAEENGLPITRAVVQDLMQYGTPQAMEQAVKDKVRIKGLEDKVTKLTQGTVPAQNFESGASTVGSMNGKALERALGDGTAPMTLDNQKKLAAWYKTQGLGG